MGLRMAGVRPSTLRAYRTHVGYLEPIAALGLGEVESEHLEAVHRSLVKRGLSAPTVQSAHRSFRSCLAYAVRRGLIDLNPA